MFQPETYAVALSFMVITMFCWGSWANTIKLCPNYRFQLFYGAELLSATHLLIKQLGGSGFGLNPETFVELRMKFYLRGNSFIELLGFGP